MRRLLYYLHDGELAQKRLDAEDARCARFRKIYAMIGLQVAVHPSGALDIGLGTRSSGSSLGSKGVMPWDESGSLSVRGHNLHLALRACLGADGDLRSVWVDAA